MARTKKKPPPLKSTSDEVQIVICPSSRCHGRQSRLVKKGCLLVCERCGAPHGAVPFTELIRVSNGSLSPG